MAGCLLLLSVPFAAAQPVHVQPRALKCAVVTFKQLESFSGKVWDRSRWKRKAPKRSTRRAYHQALGCIAGPGHLKASRRRWVRDRRVFLRHRKRKLAELRERRRIEALTPYVGPGGSRWAIPWEVVKCESRGNYGAYNPHYEPHGPGSGPGGAYQIIRQTWLGYGGGEFAPDARSASPEAQDAIARRIYEAEGLGPWECAYR